MRIVLLGPQRRPSLRGAVRALGVEGPIATVTAGWQERESEDGELDDLLDGRSVNLALYERWGDVADRDPELAAADRRRRDVLDELASVYVLRLDHAIAAVSAVLERDLSEAVALRATDEAIAAVRDLDRRHLELVVEVHAEFYDRWALHERPVVAEHRAAVAEVLGKAGALVIAGGHVGVLLACLHAFNVAAALPDSTAPDSSAPCQAIVAWSAGAMAVSERVVLFNDRAPGGHGYAEVYDAGLGLCQGIVPLPHARRRLFLDDPFRVLVFARRFAPDRCVVLDDGVRLDLGDGCCPPGTRVLTEDGRVEELEAVEA